MTQYLPSELLALFSARPPIPYKPPVDQRKKNSHNYVGLTDFVSLFEQTKPPPATRGETKEEKAKRRVAEKAAESKRLLELKQKDWDPHTDPNAVGDPFKTLFVGRVNFDTTESKLRRELEAYGKIKHVAMVHNVRNRKPRGYAFVEFENEKDMHSAYKHSDGKKIDGRRIVVDVERGRTVKSWKPRKLGGGLGGTRKGGHDDNIRHSGRVEQWERDRSERDRRESGYRRDRDRSPRDRSRRDREPRERRDRGDRGDRTRVKVKDEEGVENGESSSMGEMVKVKEEPGEGVKQERPERRRERSDRDRDRDSRRDRDRDSRRDRDRSDRGERKERDRSDRSRDSRRDRGDKDDRPPPPPSVKEEVEEPMQQVEEGNMPPPPPPEAPPPPPDDQQNGYTVSYS